MTKICSKCKRELPFDRFVKNKHTHDGLACQCKDCSHEWYMNHRPKLVRVRIDDRNAYDKARNDRGREFLFSLKTPCAKCGETRPHILQFHHIDPGTKTATICAIKKYPPEVIINEVKKCVCLCANCHFEFHFFYGNKPKQPVKALEEYLQKNFNKE